jgi:hypothetical protein
LRQDVRRAYYYYWDTNYPYVYALAQAQTESQCRSVVAFDKGEGPFQFMPKTSDEVRKDLGDPTLDPMRPEHAIKMNAYYMKKIHKSNWNGALWITYQIYNGGRSTLYQEYLRAGKTDWALMRLQCHRKIIKLKSGKFLNMCDVNYDYSRLIYERGRLYGTDHVDAKTFMEAVYVNVTR